MYDLIYAPKVVEETIKRKYPLAQITDASDEIHTERFECEIEGVEKDEFYPFAIREGFSQYCFGFLLLLESLRFPERQLGEHKKTEAQIRAWIEASKVTLGSQPKRKEIANDKASNPC